MQDIETVFMQSDPASLLIERLPDGSAIIYNKGSKNVHSLKPGALRVWEACAEGASRAKLAGMLRASEGEEIDAAIIQLEEANLIQPAAPVRDIVDGGRRSMLHAMSTAIPLVLTLTAAEQKAFAGKSKSGYGDNGKGHNGDNGNDNDGNNGQNGHWPW